MKNLRSVISLSNQGINFKESIKKNTQTKERESKRERKICNGVTRQLLQSIVIAFDRIKRDADCHVYVYVIRIIHLLLRRIYS